MFEELQCSICGYIPDQDDIDKTDYKLNTCENCGQENVCDLCLYYTLVDNKGEQPIFLTKIKCPACPLPGNNRKKVLKALY
jgi:hypothetical protein